MEARSRRSKPRPKHFLVGTLSDPACVSRIQYYVPKDTEEIDELYCVIELGDALCGHEGLAHGGLLATILDDAFGALCFVSNKTTGFTANLSINYRKPVPLPSKLLIRTRVKDKVRRKRYMLGSIEDGEGKVFVEGSALFVVPRGAEKGNRGGSAI
eukprot:CAMPEP_0167761174 /NCGR_PEP_ID=MMETSP0110_2-20121227/12017_1 /TAXON_ID=629695 /ORGANISM="Gymnochlora sp., Strain CCMP2014" /LENGTH=155 /DNA_ID=CAMNT_0007647811 /DNA_START=84 /DNA_END=551 /DNA_ORIENTATION=+